MTTTKTYRYGQVIIEVTEDETEFMHQVRLDGKLFVDFTMADGGFVTGLLNEKFSTDTCLAIEDAAVTDDEDSTFMDTLFVTRAQVVTQFATNALKVRDYVDAVVRIRGEHGTRDVAAEFEAAFGVREPKMAARIAKHRAH